MRRWLYLLLLLLAFSNAHAATPYWERPWTVTQVCCFGCSTMDREDFARQIGTKIELLPGKFVNPLYQGCNEDVDYSGIKLTSRRAIIAMTGGNLRPRGDNAYAGPVVCTLPHEPGADADLYQHQVVARFIFDGSTGYYLFEGGGIFVLK